MNRTSQLRRRSGSRFQVRPQHAARLLLSLLLLTASAAMACDDDVVAPPFPGDPELAGGAGGSAGLGMPSSHDAAQDNPTSCEPIDLYHGIKRERFVDLDVPLTGSDFQLVRMYSSQVSADAPPNATPLQLATLSGENWWLNVASYMAKDSAGLVPTNGRVTFFETPWNTLSLWTDEYAGRQERFHNIGPDDAQTPAPTDIYAQRRMIRMEAPHDPDAPTVDYELHNYATIALITPGVGERHFRARYRWMDEAFSDDSSDWPANECGWEPRATSGNPCQNASVDFEEDWMHGLLLQERDAYGNSKTYIWTRIDDEPRLHKIVCRARPTEGEFLGPIEAEIRFTWETTTEQRLASASAYRPVIVSGTTQGWLEIQRVDYTYFAGSTYSADVGTSGDLIQVAQFTRLESSDPAVALNEGNSMLRVWQYRYHRVEVIAPPGQEPEPLCPECPTVPGYDPGTPGYRGADHQLKMVIEPDAIEYATHRMNLEDTPAPVLDRANQLLTYASIGVAFTEGSNTRSVRDLASRVIQYENGASGSYRVIAQEFGSSCGCGGGGGGVPGRLLVYTYIAPEGSIADGAWAATVQMREYIAPIGGGEWEPYRDYFYDLTFFEDAMRYDTSTNRLPYLRNSAIIDLTGSGMAWVTHYEYVDADNDPNNGVQPVLHMLYTPSATGSYTPASVTTSPPSVTPPSWSQATGRGRVEVFGYTEGYYRSSIAVAIPSGTPRTEVVTSHYGATDANGLPHLPKLVERYVDGDPLERTTYSYGFHPNTADDVVKDWDSPNDIDEDDYAIAWIKTTTLKERVAENGDGATLDDVYVTYQLFDQYGNNTHLVDADGVRHRMTYDTGAIVTVGMIDLHTGGTGELLSRTDNSGSFGVDDDNLYVPVWDGNGDELSDDVGYLDSLIALDLGDGDNSSNGYGLTTTYERDALGRVTRMTTSGGVARATRRGKESAGLEREATPLYFELDLPHGFAITGGTAFDGPATKRWYTAGGQLVRESAFLLEAVGSYDALDDQTFTIEDEVSRRVQRYPPAGLLSRTERWSNINDDADIVEEFLYDGLGRRVVHVDPNGNVERTTYDVMGRVASIARGTRESHSLLELAEPGDDNLLPVYTYYYDLHYNGSSWGPVAGNGLLSLQRAHHSGDPGVSRVTRFIYDAEERQVAITNPEPPHVSYILDDQGRTSAEIWVDEAATTFVHNVATNSAAYLEDNESDRVRFVTTHYSSRGLVYRTREAVDPTNSSNVIDPTDSTAPWLDTNRWFDSAGRVIAEWGPNGPGTKYVYDGHGRVIKSYVTDRAGDDDYSDAASVSDDTVLEQSERLYVTNTGSQGPHVGQMKLATSRRRLHDATGSGELGGSNSVATYTGMGYDGADRPNLQINFGTNGLGFASGTSAPMGSGSNGVFVLGDATSASIYQRTEYDWRGRVSAAISSGNSGNSSGETRTAFYYDDVDRRVGVIENQQGSASIIRDTNPTPVEWEWIGSSLGSVADQNRATISAYDPAGNMTHLVAVRHDLDPDEDQVTRYTYTARTTDTALSGPSSSDIENLINSNSMLTKIEYPMAFDTTDSTDVVEYRVNALGETIGMEDQNGTVHDYDLDGLGRLTSDAVAVGSGVDGTVDMIEMEYDGAGRLKWTRSLSGSTVLNEVEFSYNGLGQVTAVAQNPTGEVGTGHSAAVEYVFALEDAAGNNYSRVATTKYPSAPTTDRTEISVNYGASANDANDRISRPTSISWNRPPVGMGSTEAHAVLYSWIGLGQVAEKDLDLPGIRLTRFTGPSDSGGSTSGSYPGYDHLGRVRTQTWLKDSWTSAKPPIFELRYAYNDDTDLQWREDMRGFDSNDPPYFDDIEMEPVYPGLSKRADRDELYMHDGLHRLTRAERGERYYDDNDDPVLVPGGSNGRDWTLDALGNWDKVVQDLTGNGVYTDGGDLDDDRSHNAANEITERNVEYSDMPPEADYGYDDAGNLTTFEVDTGGAAYDTWRYTYDAWNRLVKVEVDPETTSSWQTRAAYTYNGLHWRVTRYADSDASGALDEGSLFYYDENWRLLEERIDDGFAGNWSQHVAERITQRIWGLEYVDELLYFQTDEGSGGAAADGAYYAEEDAWYALLDRMFSVIGVVDLTGDIVERVRYTPYGTARHEWRFDVNGDGAVGAADTFVLLDAYNKSMGNGDDAYDPDCDFDLDGDVDFTDLNLLNSFGTTGALASGRLSAIGNVVGYDGYIFDESLAMYCVRHRWLDPDLGLWASRDPLGTNDGHNLYQYVNSTPNIRLDPLGLTSSQTWEGPEAAIISWVSGFNVLSEARRIANFWMTGDPNEGVSPWAKPISWALSRGTYNRAVVFLSLFWQSANAFPPPSSINPTRGPLQWGSKQHRGYVFLKPEISCCNGEVKNDRVITSGGHPGWTPRAGGLAGYDTASAHPTINGTVQSGNSAKTQCKRFRIAFASRVGWYGQAANLMAFGARAPYINREVQYEMCCDGSVTVDYSATHFPSHKAYLDGQEVGVHFQKDLHVFVVSGGDIAAQSRMLSIRRQATRHQ